ncbi:hypothetical protein PG993_005516 [Apiospora rasikravindrae]|uniref:Uncharacterized protein n=1 Tax=Apiospora rasikravindrae TaxID=990691 RepID=A0ABR1TFX1_9PEZI
MPAAARLVPQPDAEVARLEELGDGGLPSQKGQPGRIRRCRVVPCRATHHRVFAWDHVAGEREIVRLFDGHQEAMVADVHPLAGIPAVAAVADTGDASEPHYDTANGPEAAPCAYNHEFAGRRVAYSALAVEADLSGPVAAAAIAKSDVLSGSAAVAPLACAAVSTAD